jgi:hypothetical protein
MESRKPFPWIPVIALVIVNALWGFSFPVVKVLNEMSDLHFGLQHEHQSTVFRVIVSAWMIATRFTLALLLLVIFWNSLIRNATRQEWIAGFYIGLMFYCGLVLQVIGLATIPASRSGFLTSLTAVFTPLFGALIFRKYPTKWMVFGTALAVLGVVVLTGLVVQTPTGIGLAPDAADRRYPYDLGVRFFRVSSFVFGSLWQADQFGGCYTEHVFDSGGIGMDHCWVDIGDISQWANGSSVDGLVGLDWALDASYLHGIAFGASGILFDVGFWMDEQVPAECECIASGGDLQFGAGLCVRLGIVFAGWACAALGD